MRRFIAQLRKEVAEQPLVCLVLSCVCFALTWMVALVLPEYHRPALPPLAAAFGVVVASAILACELLAGDRHRGGEAFADRLPHSRRTLPLAKLTILAIGLTLPGFAGFAGALSASALLHAQSNGQTLVTDDTPMIALVTAGFVSLAGYVVSATRFTGRTLLGLPLALFVLVSCWSSTWILGQPTRGEIMRASLIATAGGAIAWWLAFVGRHGRLRVQRALLLSALVLTPAAELTRFWIQSALVEIGDEDVTLAWAVPTRDPNQALVCALWKTEERDTIQLWSRLDLTTGQHQRSDELSEHEYAWLQAWQIASRLGAPDELVTSVADGRPVTWTLSIPGGPVLEFSCERQRVSFHHPDTPEITHELMNDWMSGHWRGLGLVLGIHGWPEKVLGELEYEIYDPFERQTFRTRLSGRQNLVRPGRDVEAIWKEKKRHVQWAAEGGLDPTPLAALVPVEEEILHLVDDQGRILIHEKPTGRTFWLDPETGERTFAFEEPDGMNLSWLRQNGITPDGDQKLISSSRVGLLRGSRFFLTKNEGHLLRLEHDRALFLRADGTLVWKDLEPLN